MAQSRLTAALRDLDDPNAVVFQPRGAGTNSSLPGNTLRKEDIA